MSITTITTITAIILYLHDNYLKEIIDKRSSNRRKVSKEVHVERWDSTIKKRKLIMRKGVGFTWHGIIILWRTALLAVSKFRFLVPDTWRVCIGLWSWRIWHCAGPATKEGLCAMLLLAINSYQIAFNSDLQSAIFILIFASLKIAGFYIETALRLHIKFNTL
jgi:hypothetical protein